MGTSLGSQLASLKAILWKDLLIEWRSRQMLSAMIVFALLVLLIFNFALELDARERINVTAGVLWVSFAFAGTLGLNRSLAIENEGKALDSLLLAPIDRNIIYFAKFLSNLVFMFFIEAVILPVYGLLYNVNLFNAGLILVVFLGSVGYAAVGTLLASMAVQARTRDLLLPVLLFPILLPALVAAVRASSSFLSGLEIEFIWPSLNLLIAYDLIMLSLAYMFFDFVIEE